MFKSRIRRSHQIRNIRNSGSLCGVLIFRVPRMLRPLRLLPGGVLQLTYSCIKHLHVFLCCRTTKEHPSLTYSCFNMIRSFSSVSLSLSVSLSSAVQQSTRAWLAYSCMVNRWKMRRKTGLFKPDGWSPWIKIIDSGPPPLLMEK